LKRSGRAVKELIDEPIHRFEMTKRLLRSFTAPWAWLLVPPLYYVAGVESWPYVAAALTVVNEPVAVWLHRFGRDRFARSAAGRAETLREKGDGWLFESKTYALQADFVDAALRHGKSAGALRYPLWNQDFHGSRGLFGRLMMKPMLRREIQRTPVPAGSTLDLQQAEAANGQKDRWVTVDRLSWNRPGKEPLLAVTVRTSSTRPRFPKAATQPSRETSWAGAPALSPVPVPVRAK
jgi:hypothetical protein